MSAGDFQLPNWTVLGRAAACGHKDVVKLLLSKGADINIENPQGLTPLHRAAYHGTRDMVKIFLDNGAEPNRADRDGRTPLHWAALRARSAALRDSDSYHVYKLLLEYGADPDRRDENNRTAFQYKDGLDFIGHTQHCSVQSREPAARRKSEISLESTVASLHTHHCPEQSRETMELCTIDTLFYKNVPHIIEKIFFSMDKESFLACCNVSKTWKKTLTSEAFQKQRKFMFHEEILMLEKELLEASQKGETENVRRIMSIGLVDVNNMRRNIPHWTILGMAATCGHKDVVELLLDKGADPNMKNPNGLTPLHRAAYHGKLDLVKMLLDNGAEPNRVDSDGRTPLHWAALRIRTAALRDSDSKLVYKLLLEYGDRKDRNNRTADEDGLDCIGLPKNYQ